MNKKKLAEQLQRNAYVTRQFKDTIYRLIEKPKNITFQQMVAMGDLAIIGKSRLKDLSERTGSSAQTLCMMYNNLEKEGFIGRETDVNNRRNIYYFVSEKGMDFMREQRDKATDIILKIFEKLEKKDIEELEKCMEKINNIMEKLF